MALVCIFTWQILWEAYIGKKSLLNIIVHLCVHIHVCILVLLNIGRDIGSICTRMLLIPNIVIQLCINYSNIYILLVRISYVIWPSNPGIFRKIDYIFTFSLQLLRYYFFHLPLTMTWISYLDCQLIASWQNCSFLSCFWSKMI